MASMVMNTATGLNFGSAQRNYMAHISKAPLRHLRVKCMAEADPKKPKEAQDIPSAAAASTPITTTTTSSPPPVKKVSTKFGDVFAFSGPAPETINGRLAMLGFVSAIGVELASGKDVFEQLSSGGLSWFALSALVFSVASLVPMFNGVTKESKSQAIMSSNAEMWNGRFAMIGLVALAITEYLKGGPLV
uniref:TSA: Wollemia nobilis Ref_Wollemi_Transcript_13846_898 transcribed RNA sequence n=1 Tax=Wollemia nobilis TaxID=56998 RepID=A0A0C9RTI6_9CONI